MREQNSVWVLEYRYRERKNGKWRGWEIRECDDRPVTGYREYPENLVFAEDKYETRAVEYVRKEPA